MISELKFLLSLTIAGLIFITLMILVHCEERRAYDEGYTAACKDFYKGKLKMEPLKKPDGTVEWVKTSK